MCILRTDMHSSLQYICSRRDIKCVKCIRVRSASPFRFKPRSSSVTLHACAAGCHSGTRYCYCIVCVCLYNKRYTHDLAESIQDITLHFNRIHYISLDFIYLVLAACSSSSVPFLCCWLADFLETLRPLVSAAECWTGSS